MEKLIGTIQSDENGGNKKLIIQTRTVAGELFIGGGLLTKTVDGQQVEVTLEPLDSSKEDGV